MDFKIYRIIGAGRHIQQQTTGAICPEVQRHTAQEWIGNQSWCWSILNGCVSLYPHRQTELHKEREDY